LDGWLETTERGGGVRSMRRNSNGLLLIAGSVMVLLAITALVAGHELDLHSGQIRRQGVALANALSRIPLDRLAPEGRQLAPLSLVRASHAHSNFLYGAVVSTSGEILDAVPGRDALPAFPDEEIVGSSQRVIELSKGGVHAREFAAPILEDGRLVGQVRIGFQEPSYAEVLRDSPSHAIVALLVFLMVPLASLWLRSELRPLREVAVRLDGPDDGMGALVPSRTPSSDAIAMIVDRVQSFVDQMDSRSEEILRERMSLLASSKVVSHQKHRYELLLDALPDAVLGLDEAGKVTLVNARAATLLRSEKTELIGASPSSWCPAPELAQLVNRYSGTSNRLIRAEALELSMDSLGDRHYLASVHPQGEDHGVAVVLRDITNEHTARKTQAEFLAHMAHELKVPLNVISMYAESILGSDGADESFRIDASNVIGDEVDRLNGLINNIFSISRIESGSVSVDRQRVRTRELLQDIFESVSRSDRDMALDFDLTLPDAMQPIFADKALFSVAIKNLLTNAIKYNREGGKVELVAEELDGGLLIRVTDTGAGIREDDLDQIFEKFYRSEDDSVAKVTGHGLGLSLVKEIVALHGGEIQVSSELGKGSEFSLVFARDAAIFREEG
jgi:PAS domain S-box-containing protein